MDEVIARVPVWAAIPAVVGILAVVWVLWRRPRAEVARVNRLGTTVTSDGPHIDLKIDATSAWEAFLRDALSDLTVDELLARWPVVPDRQNLTGQSCLICGGGGLVCTSYHNIEGGRTTCSFNCPNCHPQEWKTEREDLLNAGYCVHPNAVVIRTAHDIDGATSRCKVCERWFIPARVVSREEIERQFPSGTEVISGIGGHALDALAYVACGQTARLRAKKCRRKGHRFVGENARCTRCGIEEAFVRAIDKPVFHVGQWVRCIDPTVKVCGQLFKVYGYDSCGYVTCVHSSGAELPMAECEIQAAYPRDGEWWQQLACAQPHDNPQHNPLGDCKPFQWSAESAGSVWFARELIDCGCLVPVNYGNGA